MTEKFSSKVILNILINKKLVAFSTKLADATVIIAITDEDEPKILLTRRSETMTHHAGEVALPGGRRENSDHSNQEVALREIYEELGITSEKISFLGELPSQMSIGGLDVKPLVALIPPNLEFVLNHREVSKVFFMPLNYFMTQTVQPYTAKYPDGYFEVSSIHFDGEIIWGLTAKIILSLFETSLNYLKHWIFYSQEIA